MSYTPFLPTLWNTVSTKFTEFSPISVGAYNIYDGALRKFTAACYEYDTSSTYVVNEYCYYTSAGTTNYYKANQAITTPEAFTPAHWDVKTTAEYMTDTSNSVTISSQFGAGASVDYAPVAESYDTSTSYGAGKMVINDGKLYRANEDTTAGAFDPAKWTQINVAGKMIAFNDQTNDNIAPIYSTAGTYDTGAIVVYANPASQIYKLYRAKEDGVTGDWDSTKWDEIAVTDQLFRFKTNQVAAKISPSTVYSVGDYATWQDELYKVTTAIPAYDASAGTYAVGDYVEQDGKFYCCKTAITTPEAFDATKWDVKTNAEMITACFTKTTIMSQMPAAKDYDRYIAPAFSESATYPVAYSYYVLKDNKLYTNTVAITTAHAWTASEWQELTASDGIDLYNNFAPDWYVVPEFSTSTAYYDAGAVVRYNQTVYQANKITAGSAFTAADWDEISPNKIISNYLLTRNLITPAFSTYQFYGASEGMMFADLVGYNGAPSLVSLKSDAPDYYPCLTYAVGDVIHDHDNCCFYVCNTDITTPEAFTEAHWTKITGYDTTIFNDTTINNELNSRANSVAIAPVITAQEYAIDDRAMYNGKLYKFTKAISTYSSSTTYSVGDVFHYGGKLYFVTATSPSLAYMEIRSSDYSIIADKYCTQINVSDIIPDYEAPWATFIIKDSDTFEQYLTNNTDDGQDYSRVELRDNVTYAFDGSVTPDLARCYHLRGNHYYINFEASANLDHIISADYVEDLILNISFMSNISTDLSFNPIVCIHGTEINKIEVHNSKIAIDTKTYTLYGNVYLGDNGNYYNSNLSFMGDNTSTSDIKYEWSGTYHKCVISSECKKEGSGATKVTYGGVFEDCDITDASTTATGGYVWLYGSFYNNNITFRGTYDSLRGFSRDAINNKVNQSAGATATTGTGTYIYEQLYAHYGRICENVFQNQETSPLITTFIGGTYTIQTHSDNSIIHYDSTTSAYVIDWQETTASIAPTYPEYTAQAYAIGARVTKDSKYYMAMVATSATWVASEWKEVVPEEQAALELAAEISALGLTRTVTYNSTTSQFEYAYTLNT